MKEMTGDDFIELSPIEFNTAMEEVLVNLVIRKNHRRGSRIPTKHSKQKMRSMPSIVGNAHNAQPVAVDVFTLKRKTTSIDRIKARACSVLSQHNMVVRDPTSFVVRDLASYVIKYDDGEGGMVCVFCDEDLLLAVQRCIEQRDIRLGKPMLTLYVDCDCDFKRFRPRYVLGWILVGMVLALLALALKVFF